VLQSIEALPPGLYGMEINERPGAGGEPAWDVQFVERTLEDVVARTNRPGRIDEKPFEAVETLSEFNQRAYELFAQPLVQSLANEYTAKLSRDLHPLRVQRWAFSDLNPWLGWLGPAAEAIKADRRPATKDNALAKVEGAVSETISASLDYYRATRDAMSEARFFQTYGNVFSLFVADKAGAKRGMEPVADARELPFVKSALAAIEEGGFPEALARVGYLLALKGEPLLLSRLEFRRDMIEKHRDLLPGIGMDQWRRIRGEQEIIARYEPERAIATLPKLLANPVERERFRALLRALMADEQFVHRAKPNVAQLAMLETLGGALDVPQERVRAAQAKLAGKPSRQPAAKRKPGKRAPAKRKAVKR
jgi:hypothetical protein